MTFSGRGFRRPVVVTAASSGGVTVRADCGQNPEAWAELTLSREELLAMLRSVDAAREASRPDPADAADAAGPGVLS